MKKIFLRVFLIMAIVLVCVGCSASDKQDFKAMLAGQKAEGYGKVISDSIANIIFDAKSVTCLLQSTAKEDTLRLDTIRQLPVKSIPIIQYLLFHPNNFRSDEVVFGIYDSWACIKIEANKKQKVYVEFDFGLAKWRLLDNKKKQICQRDMRENRMEILYFIRLLFPNDVTLQILYNNLTAKQ